MSNGYFINNLGVIRNDPSFVFAKNSKLEYIGMSDSFAKFIGWKNSDFALGQSDYQVPCKISEYADRFRADDSRVINLGVSILNLEIYNYAVGWRSMLVQKTPLKDNDSQSTVSFCRVFDVSNISMFRFFSNLSYHDRKFTDCSNKPTTYNLNREDSPLQQLSPRQEQCLFWLIRGKTFREIGECLGLSLRTIETYIEAIKNKLGCNSKGQIIEKAIDSGFLLYIPEHFLSACSWFD